MSKKGSHYVHEPTSQSLDFGLTFGRSVQTSRRRFMVININLDNKILRPTFDIDINKTRVSCLFDTGADIPVWCKSLDIFKLTVV